MAKAKAQGACLSASQVEIFANNFVDQIKRDAVLKLESWREKFPQPDMPAVIDRALEIVAGWE